MVWPIPRRVGHGRLIDVLGLEIGCTLPQQRAQAAGRPGEAHHEHPAVVPAHPAAEGTADGRGVEHVDVAWFGVISPIAPTAAHRSGVGHVGTACLLALSATAAHTGREMAGSEPIRGGAAGLRERHRRRTEATLEEVALRLFAERGFDVVTVDEIAACADVSRRTFFRYYSSKEDVLLSDHPRRLAELRRALGGRPDGEAPLTALRHAFLSAAGGYEEERERLLNRARIMAETPSLQARSLAHQRLWEMAVADMVAERMGVDPSVDLRPGVVAGATMAALRVAVAAWLAKDGRPHLPTLVAEALDLLDGGLEQGLTRLPALRRRRRQSQGDAHADRGRTAP